MWQTAAQEKEGAQSDLLSKIELTEKQAQDQRVALQEKVDFLEKNIMQKENSSGDLLQRCSNLEAMLTEKDQVMDRTIFRKLANYILPPLVLYQSFGSNF